MGNTLEFAYYYGIEAEQFSFYRIPRLLITDERFKGLSSDAILLYGLMLDRMALSMKNGWFDDQNRAYIIYTIENIREDMGRCSKEKAVKILAELDSKKGIGLVERIRRGLGKPDIIYVKNFATVPADVENEPCNADISTEVGKTDFKKSEKPTSGGQENRLQEVGKTDLKKSEKPTCTSRGNRPTEVGKTDPNYTNINKTNLSYINPINQSTQEIELCTPDRDATDVMDDVNSCVEFIKNNIEYEQYMSQGEESACDQELYEELFELICEIVCVKKKTVKINGADYPYELVRSRFLKLNRPHLEYVMESLRNTASKITNIRAYLITALYNAPSTMMNFIQQEVQHDMFGGGWEKKGIV